MFPPEAKVKTAIKVSSNMSDIQVTSLAKVLANMFVFCFRHYSCTIDGFHMTSLKFMTKTSWILLSFLVLQQLKTNIYINFHFDCTESA